MPLYLKTDSNKEEDKPNGTLAPIPQFYDRFF